MQEGRKLVMRRKMKKMRRRWKKKKKRTWNHYWFCGGLGDLFSAVCVVFC